VLPTIGLQVRDVAVDAIAHLALVSTSLNTRLGTVPNCLKRLVNILGAAPTDKLDNSGPLFTVSCVYVC
jgi:hypothetical protein